MRTTQCLPFLAAVALAFSACSSDSQTITDPGGAAAHTLSGTVISIEQPYTAIVNARVEVTSGADSGRNTQSDGAGVFTLPSLTEGPVSVMISKPGYQTRVESVNLHADMAIFPKLTPMP